MSRYESIMILPILVFQRCLLYSHWSLWRSSAVQSTRKMFRLKGIFIMKTFLFLLQWFGGTVYSTLDVQCTKHVAVQWVESSRLRMMLASLQLTRRTSTPDWMLAVSGHKCAEHRVDKCQWSLWLMGETIFFLSYFYSFEILNRVWIKLSLKVWRSLFQSFFFHKISHKVPI